MKTGTRRRWIGCALLCAAVGIAATAQQAERREERAIAPGVTYTRLARKTSAGEPWSIHVVEMSRREKKLELRSVRAAEPEGEMQRERPTEMARRVAVGGWNVLAVVNGDYDLAAPYLGISDGLVVTSGEISTTGKPAWPAMGVTSSGEPLIGVPQVEIELESRGRKWPIAALNKPLGTTWGMGPHLFTREFRATLKSEKAFRAVVIGKLSQPLPLRVDASIKGVVAEIFDGAKEVPIPAGKIVLAELLGDTEVGTEQALASSKQGAAPFRDIAAGDKVKFHIRVQINGRKNIRDVVGGFPILVQEGRKNIAGKPTEYLSQRHPRTALCTNEQKVIFVVVDGRQPQLSVGMTLDELADFMVSLGCTTAMNTDGGGSSVMAVKMEVGGSKLGVGKGGAETPDMQELKIVNSPSDGQERGRGNAWMVVRK